MLFSLFCQHLNCCYFFFFYFCYFYSINFSVFFTFYSIVIIETKERKKLMKQLFFLINIFKPNRISVYKTARNNCNNRLWCYKILLRIQCMRATKKTNKTTQTKNKTKKNSFFLQFKGKQMKTEMKRYCFLNKHTKKKKKCIQIYHNTMLIVVRCAHVCLCAIVSIIHLNRN